MPFYGDGGRVTPEQDRLLSEVTKGLLRGQAETAILRLFGDFMSKHYGDIIYGQSYADLLCWKAATDYERKRCVSLAGCMAGQPLIDAIKSGEELT